MNLYFVLVMSSVLWGFAAAFVARTKGRSPLRWFVIGAVLNVLAVAIIMDASRSRLRES